MSRTHERVRLHRGGLTGEWAAVRVSPSGVITDRWPIHPDDQAVLNDRWQTAAADRPSVTDQALAEAWAEGHRTGWEHCQDGNYGNDHWDDPTPNPYAAAGRPSVTDNARAEAAWIEWAQNLTGAYVTTPEEARQQIEGLVSGLLKLTGLDRAAGRAETTTATDEDMFEQAWEVIARVRDAHPRTVDDAPTEDIVDALIDAGLLATARTRPTREELIDALVMSPLSDTAGTDMRPFEQTADAVMELLWDGAR